MKVTGVDQNSFSAYTKLTQTITTNTAQQIEPPDNIEAETEQEPTVVISISEEAMSGTHEAKKTLAQEMEDMHAQSESLRKQLESARQQGEGIAKSFEIKRKCMLIAMRIMSGDKVPTADHRFLAENEPEMYEKAIMLRAYKEKPVKHKRLSEDEEESKGKISGAEEDSAEKSPAANAEAAEPAIPEEGEPAQEGK